MNYLDYTGLTIAEDRSLLSRMLPTQKAAAPVDLTTATAGISCFRICRQTLIVFFTVLSGSPMLLFRRSDRSCLAFGGIVGVATTYKDKSFDKIAPASHVASLHRIRPSLAM